MMKCPIYAAFEDRKIPFDGVGMNISAYVFADAVVDRTVINEFATDLFRRAAFVGHDFGFCGDLILKDRTQIGGIDGGDMVRADLAATLYKSKYGLFTDAASTFVLALAAMFVLLQAANESFVNLNDLAFAAEHVGIGVAQ